MKRRTGRPRKPLNERALGVHTTVPLQVLFRIRAEARRRKKRMADVIRQRLRQAAPEWWKDI